MIDVEITYSSKQIESLQIQGHSLQGPHGKDLVCAAVSAIGIGGLNALDQWDSTAQLEMKDGFIRIVVNQSNQNVQMILTTLIIQLKTIHEKYPKNIQIQEIKKEV